MAGVGNRKLNDLDERIGRPKKIDQLIVIGRDRVYFFSDKTLTMIKSNACLCKFKSPLPYPKIEKPFFKLMVQMISCLPLQSLYGISISITTYML